MLVPLAMLCLSVPACGGDRTPGEIHVDHLPRLVAEAEARVGDFDDPDVGFSRVAHVDVDRDGNLFVLEASVPEIRVYSPDGEFLRRIGRRGGGPGEFQDAPRFGVLGDTVWTFDSGLNRITLFDRQGAVRSTGRVEDVRVPLPNGYGYLLPRAMRPDGAFLSQLSRLVYLRSGDEPTGVEPTDRIPVPFVLFDASGAVTDTVGWAPRPPPRMWRPPAEDAPPLKFVEVGGSRRLVPSPPTTLPWWEALPDGYVLVETPLAGSPEDGVLTVTRFGLAEDTVYRRELHYRPERYSSADLDRIAERAARGEAGGMLAVAREGGGAPPVPADWERIARSLRSEMEFPAFRVPIQEVWLAQDESVWLRPRDGNRSTARWVVLDADGTPRGALDLPSDVRVLWSRGDTVWAVEPDESEVPWLVRFRIRPG